MKQQVKQNRWFQWLVTVVVVFSLLLTCAGGLGEETDVTIPDLEIQAREIPDNDALRFIRDMRAGWNLGNTFDAYDVGNLLSGLGYESAWCGVRTREELIDALQKAGFNTIRIPVSWHNHLFADWTINKPWLERVTKVVSWAYDRGMYVIINIHHDCFPDYYYPDSAHAENSEKYMRTIWTQLAENFADFDEHLIFESINEPRLTDTKYEWNWDANDPVCQDAMACIVNLNQVFVDTVRAAGGNNATRYLMVPAYDANPEYACSRQFSLPKDTAENRIIVSTHAYTPYSFALQMPGTDRFSIEQGNQRRDIDQMLGQLYQTYVAKGIPVLMGEMGAMEKNGNLQSRVDWISWYVASARARGITCCLWDNNAFTGDGERFGLFKRSTVECVYPEFLEAFMRYCQ